MIRLLQHFMTRFCPQIDKASMWPVGFSWLEYYGLMLRLPLPFRYKQYSYCKQRKLWGNVNLFISSRIGFKLWWCAEQ